MPAFILTLSDTAVAEVSSAQTDGRFWVRELYTRPNGQVLEYNTLYEPDANYQQIMIAREATLP